MTLDDARRDWTALGADDPLWAVLTLPGKRGGRWEVEEFLATGREDVAVTIRWLTDLGRPTRFSRVLDFGCGVGRLSQALAHHADEVIGVDIAPTMLDAARAMDRSGGVCTFVHNDRADLRQFPDQHFDLVYSMLVLQHLPRAAVDAYLAEFIRVLRPGGTVVVQVPTRPLWTLKGMIWRFAPYPLVGWAQRRFLGYPAAMRMTAVADADLVALVGRHGGEVLARMVDPTYTEDWRNTRYALGRAG
ncbi:MAG TPA: class I SAM-dependent methyltransferase [Micromonosporaceae bacterium]